MPRAKQPSLTQQRLKARLLRDRAELQSLRLANARIKSAAINRAEADRKRDAYLDDLYCARARADLERVEYQARKRDIMASWYDQGMACNFRFDEVPPQHNAMLAHHNLTTGFKVPSEPNDSMKSLEQEVLERDAQKQSAEAEEPRNIPHIPSYNAADWQDT